MKIYSYLASGKPVLATRILSHTQILTDQIAYLVDPTPTAIATGMRRLLDEPALGEEIGARARTHTIAEYGRDAFTRRLDAFYTELESSLGRQPGLETETVSTRVQAWSTPARLRVLFLDHEFPPMGGGAANANAYLFREFAKEPSLVVDCVTSTLADKDEIPNSRCGFGPLYCRCTSHGRSSRSSALQGN